MTLDMSDGRVAMLENNVLFPAAMFPSMAILIERERFYPELGSASLDLTHHFMKHGIHILLNLRIHVFCIFPFKTFMDVLEFFHSFTHIS